MNESVGNYREQSTCPVQNTQVADIPAQRAPKSAARHVPHSPHNRQRTPPREGSRASCQRRPGLHVAASCPTTRTTPGKVRKAQAKPCYFRRWARKERPDTVLL